MAYHLQLIFIIEVQIKKYFEKQGYYHGEIQWHFKISLGKIEGRMNPDSHYKNIVF